MTLMNEPSSHVNAEHEVLRPRDHPVLLIGDVGEHEHRLEHADAALPGRGVGLK